VLVLDGETTTCVAACPSARRLVWIFRRRYRAAASRCGYLRVMAYAPPAVARFLRMRPVALKASASPVPTTQV
jgi:hypothetical protein